MKLFLLVLMTVLFVALLWWSRRPQRVILANPPTAPAKPPAAGSIPPNSIFHKPAGAPCPAGTKLLAGYFTEKDGSTLDACYNPKGDGSIDYLNPGEGAVLDFSIPVEGGEEKGRT